MVRIYITQQGYGLRGPLCRVEHEGEFLLESTAIPFLDGARALAAKGLTGKLEMWDHERHYPRMTGTIEKASGLSVSEGEARPKIVKWTPRDYNAVS